MKYYFHSPGINYPQFFVIIRLRLLLLGILEEPSEIRLGQKNTSFVVQMEK